MNPGCGHPHYSLSRGAPSATWVLLQAGQRSERDSNPRYLSVSLVFKTSAFNRSAIAPGSTSESYDTMRKHFRQGKIFPRILLSAGKAQPGTGRSTPLPRPPPSRPRARWGAFILSAARILRAPRFWMHSPSQFPPSRLRQPAARRFSSCRWYR